MWTEAQRRMLAAMGYTLYVRAGQAPRREAMPAAAIDAIAGETPAVAADDRLWQALRRAAAGRDVAALVGDLEALRRDPRRKRALWPQLRALRRN